LFGQECVLRVTRGAVNAFADAGITIQFVDKMGVIASSICPVAEDIGWVQLDGRGTLEITLTAMPLFPGPYAVNVLVHSSSDSIEYLRVENACEFAVEPMTRPSALKPYDRHHGFVYIEHTLMWSNHRESEIALPNA
jgi:hypothetical protein